MEPTVTGEAKSGPLSGIRVIELAGIGPAPFAGMMLADMGADVIRVDRAEQAASGAMRATHRVLDRGRRSIALNLKDPRGVDVVLSLVADADVLLEGFRPGVTERLGLGPDIVLAGNPRLVYGRMTGWGQDGPRAATAGHDIAYIAVTGALEPIAGSSGEPVPPLNMLGDFGGGGMIMAFGIAAALVHAQRTGEGQVIDAAIVDGTALFTGMLHGLRAAGFWNAPRGHNVADGGAPYYGTFKTADGKWVAAGAIEPQFFAELAHGLGLDDDLPVSMQQDRNSWPHQRQLIADAFARRTRDEWVAAFENTDACVAPVLSPIEAASDPHMAARGSFREYDGVLHPAPAPRLTGTPGAWPGPAPMIGEHTREILEMIGRTGAEIDGLFASGTAVQRDLPR